MMASQAAKIHDPMYNFDTHFPERLSRLHLHSDAPASFRKKKSRANRCNSRYKTQPVTFDEITEVDEEPTTNDEKPQGEKLKGQLQAFSRSMDGLIPKTGQDIHHQHFSHSRSGSRKYHRHPDCIPERVEAESATSPQPSVSEKPPVFAVPHFNPALDSSISASGTEGAILITPVGPHGSEGQEGISSAQSSSPCSSYSMTSSISSPVVKDIGLCQGPSANLAPRRQKITAKAKKRQKASEESQVI